MIERVCVGVILGAQGLRGYARIRSFTTEPANIGAYGPVWDETGMRSFVVRVLGRRCGSVVLADLTNVAHRSEAEVLRGLRLFVPRSALPEPEEDTFYWADLVGLTVLFTDGQPAGCVHALHDFGAGTILELIVEEGGTIMVPFTQATVPEVNVAQGWVRVVRDSCASIDCNIAAGTRV
ncbi:16S rRNA processing protein RimM [invertebrate metagenome]|uniref:16S rRNA processing protein RimM n=1 Tax=invertebrate metagenome TaxID=1711999 RepID=A0A484HB68_9ZZZZ